MDKYLGWIVVAILIAGGLLATEYKSRQPEEPVITSTPFMRCMSLPNYKQQSDCLQKEGLSDAFSDTPKDNLRK